MNHRELMLSTKKRAKFNFLKLPENLQDEIMDGLDSYRLTLQSASTLLKEKGYKLSHEGVASYYRAVREQRRTHDALCKSMSPQ